MQITGDQAAYAQPRARASASWPMIAKGFALALLFLLYAIPSLLIGVAGTNAGSHYALTRALAADGTARIDPYIRYTAIPAPPDKPTPDGYLYLDLSIKDGRFYSDRPPGTAFLAVPFYLLGAMIDTIGGGGNPELPQQAIKLLPPLLGVLTALALYQLARALGATMAASIATAATAACGTLLLKYAAQLYSHIGAALCVTASLALLLAAERRPTRHRLVLGASGALLGFGALIEYPNLLLIAPVGSYLLYRAIKGGVWRDALRDLLVFGLSWLSPVLILAGYNWLVFGQPWHTSYTYQAYFLWSHQLSTTYTTPPWIGLAWLLLSPSGLLAVTPAFLLAIWGFVLLWRRDRAMTLLLVGVITTILLPTAAHRTFFGGGSLDTRYLLAIVPALYAPFALWLDAQVVATQAAPSRRLLLVACLVVLIGWGVARSFGELWLAFSA